MSEVRECEGLVILRRALELLEDWETTRGWIYPLSSGKEGYPLAPGYSSPHCADRGYLQACRHGQETGLLCNKLYSDPRPVISCRYS
jgi:hypothetical protein